MPLDELRELLSLLREYGVVSFLDRPRGLEVTLAVKPQSETTSLTDTEPAPVQTSEDLFDTLFASTGGRRPVKRDG